MRYLLDRCTCIDSINIHNHNGSSIVICDISSRSHFIARSSKTISEFRCVIHEENLCASKLAGRKDIVNQLLFFERNILVCEKLNAVISFIRNIQVLTHDSGFTAFRTLQNILRELTSEILFARLTANFFPNTTGNRARSANSCAHCSAGNAS